ncbi:MAG: ArsR/SmtB family transcription factor [Burkholderiales bacterium]
MESKFAVRALAALAQQTRLAIFRALIEAGPQGLSAGHIAEIVACPPATLSFHLKELTHAGLLDSRSESRFVIYSVQFDTMSALMDYLTENCCGGDLAQCSAQFCVPEPPKSKSTRRKHEALSRARRRG